MTKFVVKTEVNNVIQDKDGEFTYSQKLKSIKWCIDQGDVAMKALFDKMEKKVAEEKLAKHKKKYPEKYDAKKGV